MTSEVLLLAGTQAKVSFGSSDLAEIGFTLPNCKIFIAR
jgi:hypothetical protein